MDQSEVLLPGTAGHINATNSAVMKKRKKREALTQGFLESTCDSQQAMAEIFGAKKHSQATYRAFKEKEYENLKEFKQGCGDKCECSDCKTKYKSFSEYVRGQG